MNDIKQHLKADGKSLAMAAAQDINISMGLSATEAMAIFDRLWKANFLQLQDEAYDIAEQRCKHMLERFLAELLQRNPAGIAQAKDVGLQYALFNAERDFARTGDVDLEEVLVDLLVERTKAPSRDLMQITLDLSLETAPKLTAAQLDLLSLVFVLRYAGRADICSHDDLFEFLDEVIQPLVASIPKSPATAQHLEFTGCGALRARHAPIQRLILLTYEGLFHKGVFPESLDLHERTEAFRQMLIPCMHDSSKLQVGAISSAEMHEKAGQLGISREEAVLLGEIWSVNIMKEHEVFSFLVEKRPYMSDFMAIWITSNLAELALTSVGIALGHANVRRRGVVVEHLSDWIDS